MKISYRPSTAYERVRVECVSRTRFNESRGEKMAKRYGVNRIERKKEDKVTTHGSIEEHTAEMLIFQREQAGRLYLFYSVGNTGQLRTIFKATELIVHCEVVMLRSTLE